MSNNTQNKIAGKVLILGEDTRSFLGVIRSLGRKGIEVHVAWCLDDSLALYSKYIKKNHQLPAFSQEDTKWKESLIELLKNEKYDLVIPCNDQTLIPLQKNKEELAQYAKIYTLSKGSFDVAFSKIKSYQLVKDLGISQAASVIVLNIEKTEEALKSFSFPMIIKPESSFVESDLLGRNNVKKVSNEKEFRIYASSMLKNGSILIQEFFDGIGVGVELIAKDGKILTAFEHERVREPFEGGGSSYRKSVGLDATLLEAAQKIVKKLDYSGVAMIEFRMNKQTDKWIFVEINGRFWGSLPLAIAAGVDFPWYLYQMLVHGITDFSQKYAKEVYCRNLWLDIAWLREKIAIFGFSRFIKNSWTEMLRETFRIVGGKEKNDTFVFDDLMPGFMEIIKIVKVALNVLKDKILLALLSIQIIRTIYSSRVLKSFKGANSILFVCKGNICRSPFAEAYAKNAFPNLQISSAGYFPVKNRPAHPMAVFVAREYDIDLSKHSSKILNKGDMVAVDIVFVFDKENYETITTKYAFARKKIFLLGASSKNESLFIKDPFGKSDEKFVNSFDLIVKNIDILKNSTI